MKDLTKVVHHPKVDHEGFASLAVPIYRASTILFDSVRDYADRKQRGPDGYTYGLSGTPTTKMLEAQISALEQAERTILLPSGQAAIAILFLAVLKPGDTVLIPDNIYSPIRALCAGLLAAHGIGHRIYPPMVGAGIAAYIDDSVRLIWTESPGSATMEVGDLPAIVAVARARSILTGCDNSWATPLLFKPLAIGMDFVMEALTKYMSGHSDLLLGSISVRDRQWHGPLRETANLLGIGVSPDDCALALRGMETLGVRIAHIGQVSTDFARRLRDHEAVARVLHPALPNSPGHGHWLRDFRGASGLFSIELQPRFCALLDQLLSEMRLFAIGASWGGTRSLIAPMTIERQFEPANGGQGRILRISVGLEDPDDLWEDLLQMLDGLLARGST